MNRSVGIVVPAYRPDPERLGGYLHALDEHLDPAVLRVEVDAPRSDLRERLGALPDCVEFSTADARRGKGAAITAGFEALSDAVDVLAFADADGSTPADSFAAVVDAVASGEFDLATGSRRHPDADVASHQTFARRRLGDGFAWLARRFLDVQLYDYQCGAKALTAETWRSVRAHLYEPGFAWDIELLSVAGALDCRIGEVPVRWEDRPESTVSTVGTTLRLARALVTSRHRARLLREDRVHELLDARRANEPSLVDRLAAAEAAEPAEAD
ncbi:glycosyltransferase [Halobellus limi]|uniref:Glycosyl transferase family 2 n=1 Tax=Halobellus limi TaxID=699433 RepID=A0A1H6C4W0_9EURY|nr:glycosyltransferase [Halobellus limi]QCC48579.1 glycosyltransferase [Halobellus limi]SEG67396.1 Glycosyl transferase family 2 [Halobellus limi]